MLANYFLISLNPMLYIIGCNCERARIPEYAVRPHLKHVHATERPIYRAAEKVITFKSVKSFAFH